METNFFQCLPEKNATAYTFFFAEWVGNKNQRKSGGRQNNGLKFGEFVNEMPPGILQFYASYCFLHLQSSWNHFMKIL